MDISFENREIPIYREYEHQSRRTQENAECVVPDTDADIERIAAIQSEVYLKSKDLSARGVLVSGELSAVVLYIRDGKEGLSFLTIRKPFSLEFEVEAPESELLAQVALFVQGTDIRVINPRKISLGFEVEGELSCYRCETLRVESALPENMSGLHARIEEQTMTFPNAVCEKSIAVNEQFSFPPEMPVPTKLITEKSTLVISDYQLIGTKIIVKGSVELQVYALSEENDVPFSASFSAPYSQIVDIGVDSVSGCMIRPEITGAYYDLVDTINGEKALDMELHAVLQLVCCDQQEIRCITDAYSNLMPADLLCRTQEYKVPSPVRTVRLSAEEKVGLTEECQQLLHVFSSLSRISIEAGKLSVSVCLDFLFRDKDGQLSAGRRTIILTQNIDGDDYRILRFREMQLNAGAEGENINCSLMLEVNCFSSERKEFSLVDGVILDEEHLYIQEAFPTLTLVRSEGESLWALAKKYHSSEEIIQRMNENAEKTSKMLLIPKCI